MKPPSMVLPDYREQSPETRQRFEAFYKRPVKLRVEGLTKSFDAGNKRIRVLDSLNFQVYRRELITVIGPSGCGKSTLIRILAGLDQGSSGSYLLEGRSVSEPGSDRGMVFQQYSLFPWLTVKRNVMFGLEVSGKPSIDAEKEALQWIDLVGLGGFVNAYPRQLSGGMQQRVAIARVLANQPQILFMDEPFGALDAMTRSQMQAHLLEIWRNVDITIMLVTHDLDEAIYLSDRILVLKPNPGRIEEVIEVPVSRPRSPEQFLSGPFLSLKKHLEALIHPHKDEVVRKSPMIRMTDKYDRVE